MSLKERNFGFGVSDAVYTTTKEKKIEREREWGRGPREGATVRNS
jgi:hypothetical protein